MDRRDVQISKALSYLLRHGAVKEGLSIDSSGYVKLSQILQSNRLKSHKATVDDIKRIVENNDKKRFNLKDVDGSTYICATQGHSLKKVSNDNLSLLKDEEFPNVLIHGTTKKNFQLIVESEGLSKMNRNHIHFTSKLVTDNESVSGLRNFSSILIYLNIDKIKKQKISFYKSLNDVYLSDGINGIIPIEYFDKVIDRSTGEEIKY